MNFNGFTFEVRGGHSSAIYVAREDATSIEKTTTIAPACGGYFKFAHDTRYAVIASDLSQGKHGQEDLVVCSFDTVAKDFVSFAVPEASLFHSVGGPANPKWLWVKNGGSQPSTFPPDLPGITGRYDFISASQIELVTIENANSGNAQRYYLYRRTFDPATGAMQAWQSIDQWPVDAGNPTEPVWF